MFSSSTSALSAIAVHADSAIISGMPSSSPPDARAGQHFRAQSIPLGFARTLDNDEEDFDLAEALMALSRGEIDFERLVACLLHQMIVNSHAWRSPGAMRGLSFNDRLIINGLIHPLERTNLWCSQASTRLVACLRGLGVMLVEKDVVYCQRHFFSICPA